MKKLVMTDVNFQNEKKIISGILLEDTHFESDDRVEVIAADIERTLNGFGIDTMSNMYEVKEFFKGISGEPIKEVVAFEGEVKGRMIKVIGHSDGEYVWCYTIEVL